MQTAQSPNSVDFVMYNELKILGRAYHDTENS